MMKTKSKKTKELAPKTPVNYFPYQFRLVLENYDTGWQRDLREALKELKRLMPEGSNLGGANFERREAE